MKGNISTSDLKGLEVTLGRLRRAGETYRQAVMKALDVKISRVEVVVRLGDEPSIDFTSVPSSNKVIIARSMTKPANKDLSTWIEGVIYSMENSNALYDVEGG